MSGKHFALYQGEWRKAPSDTARANVVHEVFSGKLENSIKQPQEESGKKIYQ